MERRTYLQIPGPTNIPRRVLGSLATPNLNHRGAEFLAVAAEVTEGLRLVFQTRGDVLVFPGSGTGGLEAAVVNTLSPGDTALSLVNGVFSRRFGDLAEAFGVNVKRLEFDPRAAPDPSAVAGVLEADRDGSIKAVLVTHNETSTGIMTDVEAISSVRARLGHGALLLVDAVSSLGCSDLPVDLWDLDVVVTGCQKGLMLPPGLGIVSVSERAWDAIGRSTTPRWYWDLRAFRKSLEAGSFPYTPAQSLMFALRESLAMIRDEGLHQVFARHARLARGMRSGLRAMGIELWADDAVAASSLTAALVPAGVTYRQLADRLGDRYGVIIGGGLGQLQGRIFRVAHMGMMHDTDVLAVLGAVESALVDLGAAVTAGAALPAAHGAMAGPG